MEKTGLKENVAKDQQTYYEICMDENQPLLGSKSGETADLREELEFLKSTGRHGMRFETRIHRRDIGRLLRQAQDSPSEWIDLRLKLRIVTGQ